MFQYRIDTKMEKSPLVEKVLFKIARQWIAGDTMDDALQSARQANKNGMNAILNKLGEHMVSKPKINQTVDEYLTLVSNLRKAKITGGLSIKPTQVGLALGTKECSKNLETIIEQALQDLAFVWIDMESSEYTSDTFAIYLSLFEKYERLGIVIQANLKRTQKDLEMLLRKGAKIRLVKGAYHESPKNAYRTRHDVDENYKKLMKRLFDDANEFAIATHDSKLIEMAINLSRKHERKFEFQMLKGIRDELKPTLVKDGFAVAEYIPYGTNWLPYSIRRLKERKRNILLLGSSFIHSHRV
ncbi:MAG: proline dehydrogenase family protein [Nitrososphaera sp.]|jgi:proline dehydrogenase